MHNGTKELDRLEPWLDDGNIILAVQGKCFRVHRSVLGSYSEVFKDMFTIPHSDDVEQDVAYGCPIVHLQDAVEDVQIVLKAFYDRSYVFFHDEPMPIAVLTAFLRLGKKYVIGQLFKEAVHRLSFDETRLEYACKISDTLSEVFPRVSGGDPFNFMIMNIANEIGLLSTVAMAVYYCCIACPALSIADGYDFKGTMCTLSLPNQRYCLLGQRYLADAQKQLSASLTCEPDCNYHDSTSIKVFRSFSSYRGPFVAWQDDWTDDLCVSCLNDRQIPYEQGNIELWDGFPTHLGLGCWNDLVRAERSIFPIAE